MAVLQSLDLQSRAKREGYLAAAGIAGTDTDKVGPIFAIAKELLAKEIWAWYAAHYNDVIYVIRFWVIRHSIRVSDIRPIFVKLFGDPE